MCCQWHKTACEPASWGSVGITMKFHAIGDSNPPNTLLKQEGFQLAKANFREKTSRRILLFMKQDESGLNKLLFSWLHLLPIAQAHMLLRLTEGPWPRSNSFPSALDGKPHSCRDSELWRSMEIQTFFRMLFWWGENI